MRAEEFHVRASLSLLWHSKDAAQGSERLVCYAVWGWAQGCQDQQNLAFQIYMKSMCNL